MKNLVKVSIILILAFLQSCTVPFYSSTVMKKYQKRGFYDQKMTFFPISRSSITFSEVSIERIFDSLNNSMSGKLVDTINIELNRNAKLFSQNINFLPNLNTHTLPESLRSADSQVHSLQSSSPLQPRVLSIALNKHNFAIPDSSAFQQIFPSVSMALFIYNLNIVKEEGEVKLFAGFAFYDYQNNEVVCNGTVEPDWASYDHETENIRKPAFWISRTSAFAKSIFKPCPFVARQFIFPLYNITLKDYDYRLLFSAFVEETFWKKQLKVTLFKNEINRGLFENVPEETRSQIEADLEKTISMFQPKAEGMIYQKLSLYSKKELDQRKKMQMLMSGMICYSCSYANSRFSFHRFATSIEEPTFITFIDDFFKVDSSVDIQKKCALFLLPIYFNLNAIVSNNYDFNSTNMYYNRPPNAYMR